jgi:hypothetical protein
MNRGVSERADREQVGSLPFPRAELQFRGFPEFRSNVLYCPKQLFTVVVPNSSVNCIRVVSYMLRKTLGWVDEAGDPIQEQHEFSHRELEQAAGVSHSRLSEALAEAQKANFIRSVQKARVQTQGVRAQSASFELRWEEQRYTDDLEEFAGFFLQPTYLDHSGQTRLGRKNIPNIFFDHLVRKESRGVIRVVGTLLWYSIDWGKGGERKQPVKKSLRDLVELTQLDKSSVVRALDEAEQKGYVERLERGVFDLSGQKQSSSTVYGIRWTNEYTYTYEGLPVLVAFQDERPQNATRHNLENAPKTQHEGASRTLPKRNTDIQGQRPQNATQHAPKTQHGERPQNATKIITNRSIHNTSIHNSSSSPAPSPVAVVEDALLKAGFDRKTSAEIAAAYPENTILEQIAFLPKRRATKNPLGLLRRAIEEQWAPPAEIQTTDVGSSAGRTFAANFYAGYHENSDAPVSDPSPADSEAAERFVTRLLEFWPEAEQIQSWGRSFGQLVASAHGKRRQHFPALRPAIQQHGDDFYSRLRWDRENAQRKAREQERSTHYQKFEGVYLNYLRAELARHEDENTKLFQVLAAEEAEQLNVLKKNQFGLNVKEICEQYLAGRLDRFQKILLFEQGHGVLDFWQWDKALNKQPFNGVDA